MANNASHEAALSKQVAELFREHWRREPWPNEMECYSLAVAINVVKMSDYKTIFQQSNARRRRARAILNATKRLIDEEMLALSDQIEAAKPFSFEQWGEDLASLKSFEAALEKAVAVWQVSGPIAEKRDISWWHRAALIIAEKAHYALTQAGHSQVSYQKHGDFVVVVASALKMAGIHCAPTAVAKVLSKNTP